MDQFNPKHHLHQYLQNSTERLGSFLEIQEQKLSLEELQLLQNSQYTSEEDKKLEDIKQSLSSSFNNPEVNKFDQRDASLHSSVYSE